MEEEQKEKILEKVRQALTIERWGEGYDSIKVSIVIDRDQKTSSIDVSKRAK